MKRLLALALTSTLTAGPALAHGGAHVHPHGAEVWIALLVAAALVGGTIWMLRGRK